MKKSVVWTLAILGVLIAIVVGLKFSIDKKITSKIDELNSNGFAVKHQQSTNYFRTNGNGEIEIVYPDKVASYIFSGIKNEEMKKNLEMQYSLLDANAKEMIFEGVKLEYDFSIINLSAELSANIYFTSFSKKAMYNLNQEQDDEISKWMLNFLKDKKIKITIDEKGNYKLADIDTVIPNEVFITVRGVGGNSKAFRFPFMKISDAKTSSKDLLQLTNLFIDFDIDAKKQNSKTFIENIEVQNGLSNVNIKNILVNSISEKIDSIINAKSEFGFDEILVKNGNEPMAYLRNTNFSLNVNKFPVKTFEEIKKIIDDKKVDEYLKTISQAGASLASAGSAYKYEINNQKVFDNLKYEFSVQLSDNPTIDNAKGIKDILGKAKLTIDMDEQTASNFKGLLSLQIKNSDFDFINASANLKRIEAELKDDGVYINGKKVLEEKDLLFPEKKSYISTDPMLDKLSTGKGVFCDYELINENLVRVNFRYTTNLKGISSGGISVSFPQFKDGSKIVKNSTNSFQKINFYNAGNEIWNGAEEKNIISSYLLVEGWDEKWSDINVEKEFSLWINVKGLDVLQINLRGGALNEGSTQNSSEIVPVDGELDQQGYPVQIEDIDLTTLRAKKH